MCDIALIAMLIFGIVTLIRGKFLLTGAKEVRGAAARIIGVILMLPLPLTFLIALLYGIVLASQGQEVGDPVKLGMILGAGVTALCLVGVLVLALLTAQPVVKGSSRRRRNVDLDDESLEEHDEHFRPRGKAGRAEREDITDDAPRTEDRPDRRIRE